MGGLDEEDESLPPAELEEEEFLYDKDEVIIHAFGISYCYSSLSFFITMCSLKTVLCFYFFCRVRF